MKEDGLTPIFNDFNTPGFDVVFLGVNLPGVLAAYRLASAGKRVAVFCADDFARHDDFRFTRIFPENMKQLPSVGAQLGQLGQMQQSAPHLCVQQRMAWLRGNAIANRLITQAYNQLAVRNHSEKAGTLKLREYPEFSFFEKEGFPHGILCREYRYNHSRLVVEWLKAASQKGASVGNFVKPVHAGGSGLLLEDLLTHDTKQIEAGKVIQLIPDPGVFVFNASLPNRGWKNPVRISGELADYILSQENEQVRVLAYAKNAVNDEQAVHEAFGRLLSLSRKDILPAGKPESTSTPPVKPDLTLPDYPAGEMNGRLLELFPEIAHRTFPDIWFPEEDNRHISQVFELAQRKFYEAKQTGIDETWFMELFYRFGPAIDELTEQAYQLMQTTRDPHELWQQSIRMYTSRNEWARN
jgi:hypothetical protein